MGGGGRALPNGEEARLGPVGAAPLSPHSEDEDRRTQEAGEAILQNIRDLTPDGISEEQIPLAPTGKADSRANLSPPFGCPNYAEPRPRPTAPSNKQTNSKHYVTP